MSMAAKSVLTLSKFHRDLPYLYQEVLRKKVPPDEVLDKLLVRVFSYLSEEDSCKASRVCRLFFCTAPHLSKTSPYVCDEDKPSLFKLFMEFPEKDRILNERYPAVTILNLSNPTSSIHLPLEAELFLKKIPNLFSTLFLQIRELDLKHYPLEKNSLRDIVRKTTCLQIILLSYTNVSDDDLLSLSTVTTLTYVNLEFCRKITLKGIQILRQLPKLTIKSSCSNEMQKMTPPPIAPTRKLSAWELYLIKEKEEGLVERYVSDESHKRAQEAIQQPHYVDNTILGFLLEMNDSSLYES